MEGSFFDDLRQFEFFGGDQKPVHFSTSSQAPVVNGSTPYSGDHLSLDERSIDLTSFLEGYSPDAPANTVSSPGSVFSQQVSPHYSPRPALISSTVSPLQVETVFSFSSYCPQNAIVSTANSQTMYGNAGNENCLSMVSNNTPSTGEPLSASSTGSPTSLIPVVQIDPLVGTKAAPGKITHKSSKKRSLVKGTEEWRQKRDRNNDAVRKSREKSKKRIQETEHRVRELEEENRQLQSKITLLAKELNVLKSLFTSAGVAQPPLGGIKEEVACHLR